MHCSVSATCSPFSLVESNLITAPISFRLQLPFSRADLFAFEVFSSSETLCVSFVFVSIAAYGNLLLCVLKQCVTLTGAGSKITSTSCQCRTFTNLQRVHVQVIRYIPVRVQYNVESGRCSLVCVSGVTSWRCERGIMWQS